MNFLNILRNFFLGNPEQLARIEEYKKNRGKAKQVIIIRKDLKMRTGKACSQAAHASLGAILSRTEREYKSNELNPNRGIIRRVFSYGYDTAMESWIDGKFTKICVYVNSEEELLNLESQAKDKGLIHCLIQDAGDTEFHGIPTHTALAIGPAWEIDIDPLTKHLPLL